MISGQVRFSILNLPENLNPLKLKGYLRKEVNDIQEGCQENDLVFIRVFMPMSIKSRISGREIDKIFNSLIEKKLPNIKRIECVQVKNQLSLAELETASQDAKTEINEITEMLKHHTDENPPTHH